MHYFSLENNNDSIGVMKNWKRVKRLNLDGNDLPGVDALFTNTQNYPRSNYYDWNTFYYMYLSYNDIQDMSWMVKDTFAGVRYCYLNYNYNLDYHSLMSIKDQLITLKQNGSLRLYRLELINSAWADKLNDGTYEKCTNGQLHESLQMRNELIDAGIQVHLSATYPYSTKASC